MQRTYYTDSETLVDYLEFGCDTGGEVSYATLDVAATEIAAKSRYTWSEREALAFVATLSDDERRSADDAAIATSDPGAMTRNIGYHACRVAFHAIHHAAILDLQHNLRQLDARLPEST